jgi:uncharacterized surface protein with fasciclin (FAS1) repeats
MAAARKRSPSCEVLAETRLAEPRISTNDADLRVSVGLSAGFASTALTANTELPMFSRLTSNRLTLIAAAAALAITAGTAAPLAAETMSEKTVNVGGAPMYPSKNIIQNAVNSKDHTTLVAAVKAAGLVDTLSGPGPFTVFAPTNDAFAKLPAGTVDNLLKPENKATLTKVLTYHVVPGRMNATSLMKAVKDGEGQAKLKTVSGDWLIVKQAGPGKLSVTDAKGDVAMVTIGDVMQSNGVIHVIDTVLLPM